jgi:hypothetical protein
MPSTPFAQPFEQPGVTSGDPRPAAFSEDTPSNPQPSWGGPQPEAALHAPCAGHPDNPAAQVCERCGDFMCRLCTTSVEGRAYCPKCFDLLYSRGALNFSQRQFALPGVTLTLGIVALLTSGCLLAGLAFGIAGLVTGFRALKEHRRRPELPKRGVTVAGLWVSGASILISIIATGVMYWAFFVGR